MNTKYLEEQLRIATAEESKGNYLETERLARQVLSDIDIEAEPDQSTEASTLLVLRADAIRLLGTVEWRQGSLHSALKYYLEALSLAESSGDPFLQAKVMNNAGLMYASLSDYPKALQYYALSLSRYKEVGDRAGVANVIGNIGIVHHSLSNYPKALECFTQALFQHEEDGEKANAARVTGNIGNVYNSLSDYPKALEYYTRALSQHEELGDKASIARVKTNIGNVYNLLSDYPKALDCYTRALSLYEDLRDREGVARVTAEIGTIYASLSDYTTALVYLTRGLSQLEEVGNIAEVARVTGNIGITYFSLSDYPKALEYLTRALTRQEELGVTSSVAIMAGYIGSVYCSLSDYPKSLEYLYRSLRLNAELGRKLEVSLTLAALGRLFSREENIDRDDAKAETHLRESISASNELGVKNFEAHKLLAELYKRQQRWQECQEEYEKYHELKDQVQSEDAKKTAVLLDQQRQVAEREKEIAVAKAAAEAQMSATTLLLYKVLPQSIADRLIRGERVADYFRDVSILFADIVGFTPIASKMPAHKVLEFLNFVFGEFDKIVEKHGCEKIKTIGDGYLAVAGAPIECSDHAERLTRAALEMMNDIQLPDEIRASLPKGTQFQIRIGIHTGPCFGGIVGENRFVYDIYSDAVNLAARMESHGEAGKIHVSDEFCFHLQNRMDATGEDFGGIRFEEREEMEIKGKGMMRTYFLESI